MGAAVTSLFTFLLGELTAPVRIIATVVVVAIGLTLSMMPWEHGAVKFVKDSALRVCLGVVIAVNAAAIVAGIP